MFLDKIRNYALAGVAIIATLILAVLLLVVSNNGSRAAHPEQEWIVRWGDMVEIAEVSVNYFLEVRHEEQRAEGRFSIELDGEELYDRIVKESPQLLERYIRVDTAWLTERGVIDEWGRPYWISMEYRKNGDKGREILEVWVRSMGPGESGDSEANIAYGPYRLMREFGEGDLFKMEAPVLSEWVEEQIKVRGFLGRGRER